MKNNEPVAWKIIETDDDGSFTTFTENEPVWADNAIPLYTHPAKESDSTKIAGEKEFWECYSKVCSENPLEETLTDEEIYKIAMEVQTGFFPQDDTLEFARAILRKASEK